MQPSRLPQALSAALLEIEQATAPVIGRATDYPAGWCIAPHAHNKHQLLYAVRGVMVVQTEAGRWVVPPTRAIWMRAGMTHALRCVGEVHMRSLLVAVDAAPQLLDDASTLTDWARHLAVDVKTIQRLFVQQTGMTFGQWRQQARLLRALELLATDEKVIDVALALGYDSPSAFASMFRKQFGQTPSQFFAAS